MNIIDNLKKEFKNFLKNIFSLDEQKIDLIEFNINSDESKKDFGDISTNAALILNKFLNINEKKINPLEIANTIKNQFKNKHVEKIVIAGPGFINFFLTKESFINLAKEINELNQNFFKSTNNQSQNFIFSLEFVSANPTGPLHLGHGRGGIIGDVLGNILKFLGYSVTKEFYINDAGNQIKKLGESLLVRCKQQLGIEAQIPEEGYNGQYLIEIASECINKFGSNVISKEISFFEDYAKNYLLNEIKKTLQDYGIEYDVWFSEKKLHDTGQISKAIEKLNNLNQTYEKDGALWFKSTNFGDDKDRVLKKSSGELTYVAADIAYMINKIERGANFLLMILGQDHHSYVIRLKGIQQALNLEKYPLEIILYQLVKMKQSDQVFKMSKRAGNIITLRDIIDTVGKDVARFFYLNRKADAQLEFDIDLALKNTEENPVFYIQYAYVRTNAILEKAKEEDLLKNLNINDLHNINSEEYLLLKKIVSLKYLLESIAKNYQTHLLSYYVIELAGIFHRYYYNNRIIDLQNISKSKARLLITQNLKNTFETCFQLLGISAPKKM